MKQETKLDGESIHLRSQKVQEKSGFNAILFDATPRREGSARKTTKDFVRFLYIARGSLEELRYELLLAFELEFLADDEYEGLEKECTEVSAMLNSLINKLEQN